MVRFGQCESPYHGCSSTCRKANTRTGDEMAKKVGLNSAARNRSKGENIAPGGGKFNRSFYMLLTFHLAEIKILFSGPPGQSAPLIELT